MEVWRDRARRSVPERVFLPWLWSRCCQAECVKTKDGVGGMPFAVTLAGGYGGGALGHRSRRHVRSHSLSGVL